MAPRLAERGFDLTLASPVPGDFAEEWRSLGLTHVALRVPVHGGLRRADGSGRRPAPGALAREAAVVLRSSAVLVPLVRRADVVHANSLNAVLETAAAGRIANRPVVLHLQDLVAEGVGRNVLRVASVLASETVVLSDAIACCTGRAERCLVVPNGVDTERFRPGPADPRVRAELGGDGHSALIGILGRVDPEKGVDVVMRAVALLDGRRARLAVVGGPLASPAHQEEMRRLGASLLGDRVRFVPPRPDVPAVLRALDVLVNASVAEPFGMTLVEAQACGVPVVATNSGGAPEIVSHERTGLLVAPGEPRELSTALARLLRDAELRSRLAAAGRRQVEERFSLDEQVERFAGLYERYAPSRRRK